MTAQRLRDLVVVVGLVFAPWCWVVANVSYAWATRLGGSDQDGAATIALAAAHPSLLRLSAVAVMLGGILVVPAVSGFFRLAGDRLLVVIGGGLMAAGYICYAGIGLEDLLKIAMAEGAGPSGGYAAAIDAAAKDPWGTWAFILFVVGNLIGTLVLAIGLWRSHRTPLWVPIALMCWPVLHVVGLAVLHSEVAEVVGAVIQAAGFGMCAVLVARAGFRPIASRTPRGLRPAGRSL